MTPFFFQCIAVFLVYTIKVPTSSVSEELPSPTFSDSPCYYYLLCTTLDVSSIYYLQLMNHSPVDVTEIFLGVAFVSVG